MLIGYARVSTRRQRLDLQQKALEAAKCDMVISEWLSGAAGIGKGLLAAIGSCRRGDTLVVWKLDRVSRNLRELLAVHDVLIKRGIILKVLTGAASAIDLTQIEGTALYAIYSAVAELERDLNRGRTLAGLNVTLNRGIKSAVGVSSGRAGKVVREQRKRKRLRCAFNRIGRLQGMDRTG
ncbi:recombinase family protein [Mesorhizobium sp. CN2-181]|uniref:recombinase family protein n=1 Tax=Mesorhizobium yinganensis TaxID=3157707 RepID=UPI0032B87C84